MKVVVRVRPPNNMEIAKQSSTSVRVMDERILVFDPKDDSIDYLSSNRRRKQPQFLKRRARDLRFMFDRVFDHESSNRDVFEHTTKTIVEGVLGGYNCTVFAYGATGAGKTFTMLGDQSNPGVMFLTMMELYSRINACKDEKISDVAVSYLEVRSCQKPKRSCVRKEFSETQLKSFLFLDPKLYVQHSSSFLSPQGYPLQCIVWLQTLALLLQEISSANLMNILLQIFPLAIFSFVRLLRFFHLYY